MTLGAQDWCTERERLISLVRVLVRKRDCQGGLDEVQCWLLHGALDRLDAMEMN